MTTEFWVAILVIIFIIVLEVVTYSCVAIARDIDDITYYEKGVDSNVDNKKTGGTSGEHE